MRILSRLAFAAATLAGAALLAPTITLAGDNQPVSPTGWGELLVACTAAGGDFGTAGHAYWCTNDDCDGEGGTCSIGCSDEAGLETCEGSTPSRTSVKDQPKFLRALGTRFLTASVGAGDTGTPNHSTLPTAPAAPAATLVIY
jgi:hypothetical protein